MTSAYQGSFQKKDLYQPARGSSDSRQDDKLAFSQIFGTKWSDGHSERCVDAAGTGKLDSWTLLQGETEGKVVTFTGFVERKKYSKQVQQSAYFCHLALASGSQNTEAVDLCNILL